MLAALLFSTGGTAIKACTLSGWQVASFRSGIAALALLAFLPESRPFRQPGAWTPRALLASVAYAATLVSFVLANKLTSAANAIFLQATAPLYLLVLSPLVLREKIRRPDIAVFCCVGLGAILLMTASHPTDTGTSPSELGNMIGLASGFFWAWTLIGMRWLAKRGGSAGTAEATVAAGNVLSFAACLPMALAAGFALSGKDTAILLYLGIFQIGLAYVLLVKSVRRLPALQVGTLLLAEPMFNPVWAWVFQGERPGARVIAGGLAIVGGAFAGTVWTARDAAASNASLTSA